MFVRLSDHLDMTIVVDWEIKPHNKQTDQEFLYNIGIIKLNSQTISAEEQIRRVTDDKAKKKYICGSCFISKQIRVQCR